MRIIVCRAGFVKRTIALVDKRHERCSAEDLRPRFAACRGVTGERGGRNRRPGRAARRRRRPANEGPCMSASVRGASFARPRIVAPMPGLRLEYLNRSSAAIAGPTMSPSVSAGPSAELGEQVAAHQGVRRLLVQHAGVPAVRGVRRVDEADALAAAEVDRLAVRRARAARGRRNRSATPCSRFDRARACACGATASHSFIAPHSSASKWP